MRILLSIQYDATSWTILDRSNKFWVQNLGPDCCPHCNFVKPDLEQSTLEEGKLTPVPVWKNSYRKNWRVDQNNSGEPQFHPGYKDLKRSISITSFQKSSTINLDRIEHVTTPLHHSCTREAMNLLGIVFWGFGGWMK
eukprot:GFUD01002227.1.p1 GENE.GFUD01002227.1~~GFUD01002227.1.p1  ORF type:complete len:138 (+),score=14.64 GFUD01002227.1:54-467(+)